MLEEQVLKYEEIMEELNDQAAFEKAIWAEIGKQAPKFNRTREDVLETLKVMSSRWEVLRDAQIYGHSPMNKYCEEDSDEENSE